MWLAVLSSIVPRSCTFQTSESFVSLAHNNRHGLADEWHGSSCRYGIWPGQWAYISIRNRRNKHSRHKSLPVCVTHIVWVTLCRNDILKLIVLTKCCSVHVYYAKSQHLNDYKIWTSILRFENSIVPLPTGDGREPLIILGWSLYERRYRACPTDYRVH